MTISSILFLVLLAAVNHAHFHHVLAEPRPCPNDATILGYTNLTELNVDIAAGDPSVGATTYILCPDTVFDAGITNDNGAGGGGASSPVGAGLYIDTPNTTVQCGGNGSVLNNCVLLGGDRGDVLVVGRPGNPTGVTDVVVRGVAVGTTERSGQTTRVYAGGVRFVDCAWTNNRGTPASDWLVWAQATPTDDNVGFYRCNFTDNVGGSAIEVAGGGAVNVDESLFRCNEIELTSDAPILVGAGGSGGNNGNVSLRLSNSCFLNNRYRTGAVIVRNGALFAMSGNFISGSTGSPLCNGAFVEGDVNGEYSCDDFNGTSCAVTAAVDDACHVPTTSPAPAPAPAPSPGSGSVNRRTSLGVVMRRGAMLSAAGLVLFGV